MRNQPNGNDPLAPQGPSCRLDELPSESALPDALQGAINLEESARNQKDGELAQELRQAARQIIFKELNELDGFDR